MMSLDDHLLLGKISPINYMTVYAFQQYVLAEMPFIGSRGDGSNEPSLPSFFSADTCDVFWSSFIPANGGMVTC